MSGGIIPSIHVTIDVAQQGEVWWIATLDWIQRNVLGSIITGIIIAFVGVIIARANARYQGGRDHINRTAEELKQKLDELRTLASKYWASTYDSNISPLQETQLEYLLQDISALVAVCAPSFWKKKAARGTRLMAALAAETTGPTFANPARVPDLSRTSRIGTAAAELSRGVTLELG
ncbi:MAG TPA: hypothetical protein VIJ94_14700, partial [Caulobacteraceae bacterium]